MRLRNIANASEAIANDKNYIVNEIEKNDFFNMFKNNNLVNLEVGVGKGQFIIKNAITFPNHNFLGIEKYSSVLISALKKCYQTEAKLQNLKLIHGDALTILNLLPKNSISKIYLNFSDPWPKKRHLKRRLTSQFFLNLYYDLLIKNGQLILKTDNDNFFHFSVDMVTQNPNFNIMYKTQDLYSSPYLSNNIPTEYELKFLEKNKNINFLIAQVI